MSFTHKTRSAASHSQSSKRGQEVIGSPASRLRERRMRCCKCRRIAYDQISIAGKTTSRLSRNERPGIVCLLCREAPCPAFFLMLFAQRVPFNVEQDFRVIDDFLHSRRSDLRYL